MSADVSENRTFLRRTAQVLLYIHIYNVKNTAALLKTSGDIDTWLSKVDRSGFPGRFKVWLYRHSPLPRILWPILMYEVPMTIVIAFERRFSNYLQRWLDLPRTLSSAALYGTNYIFQSVDSLKNS